MAYMRAPFAHTRGLAFAAGNHFGASPEATQINLALVVQALKLPSLNALNTILRYPPVNGARGLWFGGKQGISGYYYARLAFLLLLKAHDPHYWTPLRLKEELDWKTVHRHSRAPKMSAEFELLAKELNAKRKNAAAARRTGGRLLEGAKNRPVAAYP